MDVYEAIRPGEPSVTSTVRQVGMDALSGSSTAGLKAPTNNHLRQWEFVIVNGKEERANLLRVKDMTSRDELRKNARRLRHDG